MLNTLRQIIKPKIRKQKGDGINRELKISKTAINASKLGLLRNDEKALVDGWIPGIRVNKEYLEETFKGFDHHKCPYCFQEKLQQIVYNDAKAIYFCHSCEHRIYLYTLRYEPPVPGWLMDFNYQIYYFFKEK